MQYYINKQTNKISKGANFGASFRKEPYRSATQEEINKHELEELKNSKISICKSYLTKTDWRPIRELDLQGSYQDSDKLNRNLARTAINDLEDLTTLEEVQNYDISKFE